MKICTTCPTCGAPAGLAKGWKETCVAYGSPSGHRHNDNCRSRQIICSADCRHYGEMSIRRTCPRPDCTWKGRATCFCHPGPKVDAWPDGAKP